MSLYAIKDEDGELRDTTWDSPNITREFYAYTGVSVDDATRETAEHRGSRVVELVEKAELVKVSENAGKLLAGLKREADIGDTPDPMYVWVDSLRKDEDMSIGDIFRALDVGWTVKQPQRWYVKVPRVEVGWYVINVAGILTVTHMPNQATEFAAEEIDKYHLGGFETVEVEDHE